MFKNISSIIANFGTKLIGCGNIVEGFFFFFFFLIHIYTLIQINLQLIVTSFYNRAISKIIREWNNHYPVLGNFTFYNNLSQYIY